MHNGWEVSVTTFTTTYRPRTILLVGVESPITLECLCKCHIIAGDTQPEFESATRRKLFPPFWEQASEMVGNNVTVSRLIIALLMNHLWPTFSDFHSQLRKWEWEWMVQANARWRWCRIQLVLRKCTGKEKGGKEWGIKQVGFSDEGVSKEIIIKGCR